MVRLKAVAPLLLEPPNIHFNSNMVRLKERRGQERKTRLLDFNSNMVRLKGLDNFSSPSPNLNFNSNMVRLKVVKTKAGGLF